ncbi:hypothetical protein HMPREF9412_5802 [Paenibacillus sp. HGF5]|nr:hypothetical protein HMPREF9412_5802 [Paenibacillus sp. HGF5]
MLKSAPRFTQFIIFFEKSRCCDPFHFRTVPFILSTLNLQHMKRHRKVVNLAVSRLAYKSFMP